MMQHKNYNPDLMYGASQDDSTLALPNTEILVGNASGLAGNVALSGDATISNTGVLTLANDAVSLENLDAGITPSHIVVFGAKYTTGGGNAAEAITVTGAVAATDFAIVTMVDDGTSNVTITYAVVTNNALTVTFSGDPGTDAIISYIIMRAAA